MVKLCKGIIVLKHMPVMFMCVFMLSILFGLVAHAQSVVASTSLAGAIARAGGAREVRVLTPSEIKHPPEYELKPSDLLKLEGVNVVIYAGYERMVEKLVDASRNKKLEIIKIDTTTSPQNLIDQTKKVAAVLHTEKEQKNWEKGFLEKLDALRKRLALLAGKQTVVHFHAQPFARWAGCSVVQVIPPGELSLKAVADALAKKPDIVIDILHLPAAKVVADNAHCRYAQIINFPAIQGTTTLEDVFEYNTEQILKAFQEK